MPDDDGVVRRVAWREVLPWLIIFRAFRISISPPVLLLATAGWLLTPLGSWLAERLFLGDSPAVHANWLPPLAGVSFNVTDVADVRWSEVLFHSNPVVQTYRRLLLDPCLGILSRGASVRQTAYHVFCGLWNIAVWSLFGVAIIRMAALRLGREERATLGQALRFAVAHYSWSALAPLFPLLGVVFATVALAVLGLLMWIADFGVLLAALVWPLALVGGLAMTMLLLGLLAGWPLMWPTIASEQYGDAFEAFSRSFSYAFQRPLQYLFYILLAVFLGSLGWVLVWAVSESVVQLPQWAAAWGAGSERIGEIIHGEPEGVLGVGAGLLAFFNAVIRLIAVAFQFSYFFCVATAIYLVLRRDLDQTDFDEVFVEDEGGSYSLPPLQTSPDGVPTIAERAHAPQSEDSD